MTVESAQVRGRRKLRFRSFDDVLADAENVNFAGYLPLGNWTLGQAVKHLGNAMHGCIDGVAFEAPLHIRILGRLVMRYVILYWQFPPGAKLPRPAEQALVPANDTDFDEGMNVLRQGIKRLAVETRRVPHPVIGRLSVDQWNRFHLRHAELHLSFFVPRK
jgi:hypothetical protein